MRPLLTTDQADRLVQATARGVTLTGLTRLLEWTRRSNFSILRINLTDTAADRDGESWTPSSLTSVLHVVSEHYNVVTIDEVATALHNGGTLPESAVVLVAPLVTPPGEFALDKVLAAVQVPCMITASPGLLDTGRPPWPHLIRAAIRRVPDDAVDMDERRYSVRSRERRQRAAADIIRRVYEHCEIDRSERVNELVQSWKVDPSEIRGIEWPDFERLANTDYITPGVCGLTGDSLVRLPLDRAIWELREARRRMSDRLGCEVLHGEYPWGDFSRIVSVETRNAGYQTAIGRPSVPGALNGPRQNPYELLSRSLPRGSSEFVRADLAGILAHVRPVVDFFAPAR